MSNKYNTQLQSNNIDLQAILTSINELPEAGGGDPVLQDKIVTPTTSKQTVTADSGYAGLDTVTVNAMPTAPQATPAITVNASGLITATANQTAGYVAAGSKSATKQLAFQAAKTITPTTTNQTAVSSGYYTGGAITVKGDSNLVAGNIKSGVSIFGVNGTYEGNGGDTSIEDALVTRNMTSYTNDRVTSIGDNAFYGCQSLTSINFPNVASIGEQAFCKCINLNSIYFPNAVTICSSAFMYCSKLTSVNFPKVSRIETSAFSYCTGLNFADFPEATRIEAFAFQNCSSLSLVNFPKATYINNWAFSKTALTVADFPNVTSCGQYAFQNCSQLITANFPEATYLSQSVFNNCINLTTISFPKLITIYNGAFYSCSKLTAVNFPKVEEIWSAAFYKCSSLSSISFPKARCVLDNAFYACSNLTVVNFPMAQSIGSSAFYGCSKITSMELPMVKTIGASAMRGCYELTSISLPAVTSFGNYAFEYCSKLARVYLLGSTICSIPQSYVFRGTRITSTSGAIYVRPSLVSAYKSATNWAYYSNIINYHGIGSINDNSIRMNSTKTITINTNFLTTPQDVSVVSQENDVVSISNVSADLHNITFDATAFNTTDDVEVELVVTATDDNTVWQETLTLNVLYFIGDIDVSYFDINSTKTCTVPLRLDGVLPNNVNVVPIDSGILSVSNVQCNDDNITFDITSYDTAGLTNISITIVDNGVSYTKEFIINVSTPPTYTITSVDGAPYTFADNGEYYQSQNKGTTYSYAMCKLNITAPSDCTVYIDCKHFGGYSSNISMLSELDTMLTMQASVDSSNVYKTFSGTTNTITETVSYEIPRGEHFICIKYYCSNHYYNVDSLQFKVRFEY